MVFASLLAPRRARGRAALAAAAALALAGTSSASGQSRLPEALLGRWRTEAVHFHADGTRLREKGDVECTWTLRQTYILCTHDYVTDDGAGRSSIKLYAIHSVKGPIDVVTLYAGRTTRVVQRVDARDELSLSLSGTITLSDRRPVATRGRMVAVGAQEIVYRNETEEAPGKWRMDYEETFRRGAGQPDRTLPKPGSPGR